MSEICDAAGVHCRDAAEVEDLHKEPEADQQGGRNEGDPNEDQEENDGFDAIAGIGYQEGSHDCGNRSAGAETGDLRERIAEDLTHHCDDTADQIEEDEAAGAHCVFDFATEGPEIDHVADDVHPTGMHEHRREDRDPARSVNDPDRHD